MLWDRTKHITRQITAALGRTSCALVCGVMREKVPRISIQRIWTDEDEMLQVEVAASNNRLSAEQDFYVYPAELMRFSEQLQSFPSSLNDVVELRYGEDPKFYCFFLLRALVLDSVGHCAIELKFDNRSDPPLKAAASFFMAAEAASINSFGAGLQAWCNDMSEEFVYEWKSA